MQYRQDSITGESEGGSPGIEGCSCGTSCGSSSSPSCSCIDSHGCFYVGTPPLLAIDAIPAQMPLSECGPACSCPPLGCPNRVAQQGVRARLLVKPSKAGFGLFAAQDLEKGTFICVYAGRIVSTEEATETWKRRAESGLGNCILTLRERFGPRTIRTQIDPTEVGNVGRFINHGCPPLANLIIIPVRRKGSLLPLAAFFATRPILEGEELLFDYADAGGEWYFKQTKAESSPVAEEGADRTPCLCGSPSCRTLLPFTL